MRDTLSLLTVASCLSLSHACVGHDYKGQAMWPQATQHGRNITAGKLGRTAINNVRVFDGYTISDPRTVIVDGERIGSADCAVDSSYDAQGRILIPGLIDSHVHPASVEGMQNLTSYGVTTAMNMACHNYTLCHQLKHQTGLASFVTAGQPAVGPYSSHAKSTPSGPYFYNTSEAQWVQNVFNNGSDFLKITSETGGPSRDSILKLIADTHALGKATATHASAVWTYQLAIDTRTDHIQHVPLDGNITTAMVKAIVAQQQTTTPTIYIERATTQNPSILVFLGASQADLQAAEAVLAQAKLNLRTLHQGGAVILAGTDAVGNILPTINVPFGLSLHQELVDFVDAGMSPAEALRAATSVPAYAHRLYDRGHILPGMRADLVLLNRNPLINISNTLDMKKVWVGGREYPDVQKLSS